MLRVAVLLALFLALLSGVRAAEEVSGDVVVTRVARELDLTTHLVKQRVSITIENGGDRPLSSFHFIVDSNLVNKMAYIGATVCTAVY